MGSGSIRLLHPRGRGARWLRADACALLAAMVVIPAQAAALPPKTAVGRIGAAILSQASIVKTADLDFGTIAPPNTAGTVVLTGQSSATCTTTGSLVRVGPCRAAAFSIFYRNNKHVFIRDGNLNNGQITLSGPGGATMKVTNLTMGVAGLTGKATQGGWDFGKWTVSDPAGFAQLYLGGTLQVSAGQTPGNYAGTLTIEVQMN
jgi:hypothetical protein